MRDTNRISLPLRRARPWLWACLAGFLLLAGPSLRAETIDWRPAWQLRLNGQLLSVKPFTSRFPPDIVLRDLARTYRELRRFLVGDGRVLMSGMQGPSHRVAEVQGRPGGAQGYVSTLSPGPTPGAHPMPGAGPERIFDAGPAGVLRLAPVGTRYPSGADVAPSAQATWAGRLDIPVSPSGAAHGRTVTLTLSEP